MSLPPEDREPTAREILVRICRSCLGADKATRDTFFGALVIMGFVGIPVLLIWSLFDSWSNSEDLLGYVWNALAFLLSAFAFGIGYPVGFIASVVLGAFAYEWLKIKICYRQGSPRLALLAFEDGWDSKRALATVSGLLTFFISAGAFYYFLLDGPKELPEIGWRIKRLIHSAD